MKDKGQYKYSINYLVSTQHFHVVIGTCCALRWLNQISAEYGSTFQGVSQASHIILGQVILSTSSPYNNVSFVKAHSRIAPPFP